MDKNKQIEETANEMYRTLMLEAECELSGMDCAVITSLLINRKGYRKASDVAEEIFVEISKASADWETQCMGSYKQGIKWGYVTSDVSKTLAELKKKYTEER